jgi:hypothetical protein
MPQAGQGRRRCCSRAVNCIAQKGQAAHNGPPVAAQLGTAALTAGRLLPARRARPQQGQQQALLKAQGPRRPCKAAEAAALVRRRGGPPDARAKPAGSRLQLGQALPLQRLDLGVRGGEARAACGGQQIGVCVGGGGHGDGEGGRSAASGWVLGDRGCTTCMDVRHGPAAWQAGGAPAHLLRRAAAVAAAAAAPGASPGGAPAPGRLQRERHSPGCCSSCRMGLQGGQTACGGGRRSGGR